MSTPGQFTLHDAAEKILLEKGLQFSDDEIKAEAIADIVQRITDRIDSDILDAFNEQQREQFDALISKKASPQEVHQFIATHVQNMPQIVASAIIDIRNLYLSK